MTKNRNKHHKPGLAALANTTLYVLAAGVLYIIVTSMNQRPNTGDNEHKQNQERPTQGTSTQGVCEGNTSQGAAGNCQKQGSDLLAHVTLSDKPGTDLMFGFYLIQNPFENLPDVPVTYHQSHEGEEEWIDYREVYRRLTERLGAQDSGAWEYVGARLTSFDKDEAPGVHDDGDMLHEEGDRTLRFEKQDVVPNHLRVYSTMGGRRAKPDGENPEWDADKAIWYRVTVSGDTADKGHNICGKEGDNDKYAMLLYGYIADDERQIFSPLTIDFRLRQTLKTLGCREDRTER